MPMARITTQAHQRLQELAARRGQSQQEVLDDALALLERRQFFAEAHRAYAELRADPEASAVLERERSVLDGVNADGIEGE